MFAAGGIGARRRTASHLGPTAFIRGLEINSVHNAFLQIEVKAWPHVARPRYRIFNPVFS